MADSVQPWVRDLLGSPSNRAAMEAFVASQEATRQSLKDSLVQSVINSPAHRSLNEQVEMNERLGELAATMADLARDSAAANMIVAQDARRTLRIGLATLAVAVATLVVAIIAIVIS